MLLNDKCQAVLNQNVLALLYTRAMTTGTRIRKLRTQAGLSQEKFGELFGVTKGMVSQWESDLVTPPPDRLIDMKTKLNISIDWLLTGAGMAIYDNTPQAQVIAAMEHMDERTQYQVVKVCNSLAEPETSTNAK